MIFMEIQEAKYSKAILRNIAVESTLSALRLTLKAQ
jgi:hypothetical protein